MATGFEDLGFVPKKASVSSSFSDLGFVPKKKQQQEQIQEQEEPQQKPSKGFMDYASAIAGGGPTPMDLLRLAQSGGQGMLETLHSIYNLPREAFGVKNYPKIPKPNMGPKNPNLLEEAVRIGLPNLSIAGPISKLRYINKLPAVLNSMAGQGVAGFATGDENPYRNAALMAGGAGLLHGAGKAIGPAYGYAKNVASKYIPSKETIQDILFHLKNKPQDIANKAIGDFPIEEYAKQPSVEATKKLFSDLPNEHYNPTIPKEFSEYENALNPKGQTAQDLGKSQAEALVKSHEGHRREVGKLLNPIYKETKDIPIFNIETMEGPEYMNLVKIAQTVPGKVGKNFIKNPDSKNTADLITDIGHKRHDLARSAKIDPSRTKDLDLAELSDSYNFLKDARTNFIKENFPHLSKPLEQGLEYFKKNVVPFYKDIPTRQLVKKEITNPKNIESIFEYPEIHTEKIASEIPGGYERILASKMYNNLKNPTASSLTKSIEGLEKQGLDTYNTGNIKELGKRAVLSLKDYENKQQLGNILKENKRNLNPESLTNAYEEMSKTGNIEYLPKHFRTGAETIKSMVEAEKPYNTIATKIKELKLGKDFKHNELSKIIEDVYREGNAGILPKNIKQQYEDILRSEKGSAKIKKGYNRAKFGIPTAIGGGYSLGKLYKFLFPENR